MGGNNLTKLSDTYWKNTVFAIEVPFWRLLANRRMFNALIISPTYLKILQSNSTPNCPHTYKWEPKLVDRSNSSSTQYIQIWVLKVYLGDITYNQEGEIAKSKLQVFNCLRKVWQLHIFDLLRNVHILDSWNSSSRSSCNSSLWTKKNSTL